MSKYLTVYFYTTLGHIISKGKLMLIGGSRDDTGTTDLIELVSLQSSSIAQFTMPKARYGHCNIKVWEATYLITGGRKSSVTRNDTYFQNFKNGTTWDGPSLNHIRRYHACTKFKLGGVNYALVLGGKSDDGIDGSSIEYLNLDQDDAVWVEANSK